MSRGGIVLPGAARITLVLLAIVPAAMSYPWRAMNQQWILAIAAVVVAVLLSWWRGQHVTTMVRRRLSLLGRGDRREPGAHGLVNHSVADASTTVVLRLLHERDGDATPDLPLSLIANYVDRYGIRCDAVRVTTRDSPFGRSTWVGLTVSAAANLAALRARSATIPLRATAEIALRRLADHLREDGCSVTTIDIDVPDLLGPATTERWRSVQDGTHGFVTAYGVAPGVALAETLKDLWALPAHEVWTVLQFSGSGENTQVAVACAVRSEEQAAAAPPLPGLVSQSGRQRAALAALHPLSTEYIAAQPVPWPANRVEIRT